MRYGARWPGVWATYRRSGAVRWTAFWLALVLLFFLLLWLLNLPVSSTPSAPASPALTGA